jgi:hypothetical protein
MKNAYRSSVGKPEGKRDHSEDLCVDRKIILEWILRKRGDGVVWMRLAEDRNQWLAVVNTLMNLWVA